MIFISLNRRFWSDSNAHLMNAKDGQIDAFKWLIILQSDYSMFEPVEIEDKMIKL